MGSSLRGALVRCVVASLLSSAVLGAAAGSALALGASGLGHGSGYYVTFVARSCPTYTDIYANRARNDIQESLQDLGPNSQYGRNGRLVNPYDESRAPENVCAPVNGWQFTLGRGYRTRAVTGPWGSLSIATNVFGGAPIVTEASTALLDQDGLRIGRERLPGATTIELTREERKQASSRDQLWTQGGTPADPILAKRFPGPEYGFGALRCATDSLNGDNVEYIYFPTGVRHVFCYALYVKAPPTGGRITIEKRVTGTLSGDNPSFPFRGSISYDPSGFRLATGQSKDFYRAGGATWTVTEGAVADYRLTSVECSAKTARGGPGNSTVTLSVSTAAVHLVAGEHVTCVYSNRYVPPTGGLELRKVTTGGVARFGYSVSPASGGEQHIAHATTIEPEVPVDAEPSPLSLAPGSYTVRETVPSSPDGHWRALRVQCNGLPESTTHLVKVEIRSGTGTVCTFVNAFIPRGSISIAKVTQGATGSASFVVNSLRGEAAHYLQDATTTKPDLAADAVPATAADATDHLSLGRYTIVEQLPPGGPVGAWTLTSVVCNGVLVPFDQGTAQVSLTPHHPHVHCVFTNTFSRIPEPPTPPPTPPTPPPPTPLPTPPPTPTPPAPIYELSDLIITKHASTTVVTQGQAVFYRINVKNLGPDASERVVVSDQLLGGTQLMSIRNPAGRCTTHRRVVCQLGTLKPGAQVTLTIRVRLNTPPSNVTNRAVVGTATEERSLANNVAQATVRVIMPIPPPPGRG